MAHLSFTDESCHFLGRVAYHVSGAKNSDDGILGFMFVGGRKGPWPFWPEIQSTGPVSMFTNQFFRVVEFPGVAIQSLKLTI